MRGSRTTAAQALSGLREPVAIARSDGMRMTARENDVIANMLDPLDNADASETSSD